MFPEAGGGAVKVLWGGEILSRMPTGGVARYCAELMRAAGRSGTEVLALCPPGAPPYPVAGEGIRQITAGRVGWVDRVRRGWFGADLFQAGYYESAPVAGLPSVQIAYDFLDARYPVFGANAPGFAEEQRRRLEAAGAVIAISEATRADVLRFTDVPEERVSVLYPVLPAFLEACGDRPAPAGGERPYWLWVGPRGAYKNFGTFLEGYCRTGRETGMDLVLAGGKQMRLEEGQYSMLMRAGLLERVRVLPRVSDEALYDLYAGAFGLVQSSLWEGFGIPLVEALWCGARLVVSDIPVFREVAGEAAVYADPQDGEAWAGALREAAGRPAVPVGAHRPALRERFGAGEVPGRLKAIYERVVSG